LHKANIILRNGPRMVKSLGFMADPVETCTKSKRPMEEKYLPTGSTPYSELDK